MEKRKSRKKIVLAVILMILILLLIGWCIMSIVIYNQNFNHRFTSDEPLMMYPEDFEGLQRTRYEFPSDKGQMLTGYLYEAGTDQRGIIVLAHGMGAGHNSYMDCADYFAQNGYYVFAYDATGCDESEGEGIGCVPQGVADLDHAISFVEDSGNFPELPIVLFGHSWGGYSACNVLTYHPEVRAVIECSGCNRSSDLFEAGGLRQAGGIIYTMLPFTNLYERIRCGKYAANSAMDGFAASDAAVLVLHSADDGVLPIRYGYDVYYNAYQNDPRFTFIRYEDRGHNYVFHDLTYIREFETGFEAWRNTLDYDYQAAENRTRFQNDRAAYIQENLDREKWCNSLDTELFEQFVSFYDAHIQ